MTFFVTLAYVVVRVLHHSVGESHKSGANKGIAIAILILLLLAALNTFRTRKTAKPPEWMGKLESATPKKSFRLGFLLLRTNGQRCTMARTALSQTMDCEHLRRVSDGQAEITRGKAFFRHAYQNFSTLTPTSDSLASVVRASGASLIIWIAIA